MPYYTPTFHGAPHNTQEKGQTCQPNFLGLQLGNIVGVGFTCNPQPCAIFHWNDEAEEEEDPRDANGAGDVHHKKQVIQGVEKHEV